MEHKIGQIAEYGTEEFNNNKSVFTIIDFKEFINAQGITRKAEFYRRSEGYKLSGSCATWTSEVYGFRIWTVDSWWGEFLPDKEKMQAKYNDLGKLTE